MIAYNYTIKIFLFQYESISKSIDKIRGEIFDGRIFVVSCVKHYAMPRMDLFSYRSMYQIFKLVKQYLI